MELGHEDVESIVRDFYDRCELARAVGGIAHEVVVDQGAAPAGYWLDDSTMYWIPGNVPRSSLDGYGASSN